MIHYNVHVGENGSILIPTTPFAAGEEIKVVLLPPEEDGEDVQVDPSRILPNGKTAIDDFLDFCKELNLPPLTDEEADQVRFEYLMEKYG